MYFTREDIRNIQHLLAKYGVKDSEFRPAKTPLDNNDIITLVQDGYNVKLRIADFLQQLHLLSLDDFINITDQFAESGITLLDAIRIVPEQSRKVGLVITFENSQGKWEMWQYSSHVLSLWNNVEAWENIKTTTKSSVTADEEDLTVVENRDTNVLKFKDRAYNPDEFSCKGLVYLRKNIINFIDKETGIAHNKNILSLTALAKENTIYIIRYDYDLNGKTIYVPADCVLYFDGGRFSNGILECLDTILFSPFGNEFNRLVIRGKLITQDLTEYNKYSGTVNDRPTNPRVGFLFFDIDVAKPIFYAGNREWVDATGTTV